MGQTTLLTANLGLQCLKFTPTFQPFQLQRSLQLFSAAPKKLYLDTKAADAFPKPAITPFELDEETSPKTVKPVGCSSNILRQESPTPKVDFLGLPTDVLYLISDHLDVASAYSLALTCRGLWQTALPQTRRKRDLKDTAEVLLAVENDSIADGFFFCDRCVKLHHFKQTWGPHSQDEVVEKGEGYHCGLRDRFSPTGNAYEMAYHHLRLVMNAHFYGQDQGIPLQNLCIEHDQKRQATTINCKTNAAIFKDELLLNRVYTFTVQNDQAVPFRSSTGFRDFRICEHVPFFRQSSIYHQNLPELLRKPRGGSDEFVACTSAPGSCGICLMDYDITIKRLDGGASWRMIINTYHLLGDGRNPDDWKWARFTEKSRSHLFLPNRPNRRGSGYASGVIKRTWSQARRNNRVVSTATLKRHSV